MAINVDFNLENGVKAPRKMLRHYVNLGTGGTKEWELIGKGVEDSSIALNPDTTDSTDIYGEHEMSVTGWKPTQDFTPFTVRGGSGLAFKLHEIWMSNTPEKLSQFEVLTVYSYVGNKDSGYDADVQENCTINITSIGGSANVDMPVTISYSNVKKRGTVNFTDGVPTFTADETGA